jgi:muramoyltetrapeptide carboxypeptidase
MDGSRDMTSGRTIQLIAPSGWPAEEAVRRGVDRLLRAGHRVVGAEAAGRRYLRFAGSDAERAEEINRLADPQQPLPDVVMAVRGGYGIHRLLDHLDYAGLRRRLSAQPCAIVGHSDMTALSMALLARARLTTFAGPMLAYDFGAPTVSGFTLDEFWSTVRRPLHTVRWQSRALELDVHGMLWGGNLAVLCSLVGTPYLPPVERGILFLEDVFEPMYRIERLLYQLHHAGILARQRALVLGDFSSYRADEYSTRYDYDAVVSHIRGIAGIPVITGLPFGHCRDKTTLPIGARARLRVQGNGQAELAYTGYPNLATAARAAQTP